MRDVIEYLESLACTAGFERGSDQAVRLDRIPVEVRTGIVEGDADRLKRALGLPLAMACMITAPGDEDGFDEQPAVPDEQPDEAETRAA